MASPYAERLMIAMGITDQTAADLYFDDVVTELMRKAAAPRADVERAVRSDLGYFAGYYDHETRLRVEALFQCVHPFFGPATNGPVDPKTAFELGKALGEKMKRSAGEIAP